MDEKAYINAAQTGDTAAFNQLVRIYQALVYRTAFRVLGDGPAAEDATQDALVSAFKNIRGFRGGSFKAWLLRIITNTCYDKLRVKQRRPTASLDALMLNPEDPPPGLERAPSISPQEWAEQRELNAAIQRGLATLPADQRVTLVLVDIEGLAYEEVAESTGANVGTVKSRLSRARAHLRDFLVAQEELVPSHYRLKSGRF